MKTLTSFSFFTLYIFFPSLLFAQGTSSKQKSITPSELVANDSLFESEKIIELTLSADLSKIKRDIGEIRKYHPATISYTSPHGEMISVGLKVKTRGKSRRLKELCGFPPILLNFQKNTAKGSIFEGQNKLKLVTHCQDFNKAYKEYILREYIVYKAYNLLTNKSFRVRLLKINYIDNKKKNKQPMVKYGFVIESQDFVAKRLEVDLLKNKNMHPENTDKLTADRVAIFQYMIGNLDWSIPGNHNMKIFIRAGFPPFCIPYDFDLTGIVNTVYAIPPPMFKLDNVQDRMYRGFCRTAEEFEVYFKEFRAIKKDLYALYSNSELLSDSYITYVSVT